MLNILNHDSLIQLRHECMKIGTIKMPKVNKVQFYKAHFSSDFIEIGCVSNL